jgi:hypothetical protein
MRWLLGSFELGAVYAFGDAANAGDVSNRNLNGAIIAALASSWQPIEPKTRVH